jgi:uncharacterized OB-fold protein
VESAGRGTVVSCTAIWRPPTPDFEAPVIAAIVALDEGYDMMTNLVGVDSDKVEIGARVRVRFVEFTDEITLPCFAPDPALGSVA